MSNVNVSEILEKKDEYLEKLNSHVDGIREVIPYLKLINFIEQLSTEILDTNDEWVEELDKKFGLSNFEASSCKSCFILNVIKNESIKFIENLDKSIEDQGEKNFNENFGSSLGLMENIDFDEDFEK